MPQIHKNFSLKNLNTFGVEAFSTWYTEINTEQELSDLFADEKWKLGNKLVLGGGSNMLFTRDFDGLVIKMNIRGINYKETNENILVQAGAGEIWHNLVMYCVEQGFAGLENLSLIPGSVGASPIQNIGAYGVELKDTFYSCRAFEISTGKMRVFDQEECKFGYRDSLFKTAVKGQYIITEVTFKLSRITDFNTSYGAIEQELQKRGISNPSLKDISDVVANIRVSKLPDPSTIGNAGSFFKNPIISFTKFRQLQSTFPDIVHFLLPDDQVKLAAGWLIEQCGWKGKVAGHTGTWINQALVLVNHGGATGKEVFSFSEEIISSVKSRFNILLEREVNII
ncbi:MAG TPA: UDP-N-acetylmuramate dehydrogenase [Sphingobacteriaceae bacterium]|nr:UDP-N-acetylmuramate dehydrogenase [Sphingobacteriaceae bacterium]